MNRDIRFSVFKNRLSATLDPLCSSYFLPIYAHSNFFCLPTVPLPSLEERACPLLPSSHRSDREAINQFVKRVPWKIEILVGRLMAAMQVVRTCNCSTWDGRKGEGFECLAYFLRTDMVWQMDGCIGDWKICPAVRKQGPGLIDLRRLSEGGLS